MRELQHEVKRNWYPPKCCLGNCGKPVVAFKLHRDGSITDIQVIRKSNIQIMDESAMRALQAVKLQPVPDSVWERMTTIRTMNCIQEEAK